MQQLNSNWFVEGLQDFEYKKYVLLAYLQGVKQAFDQALLYPVFSELMGHYQELHTFQQRKSQLEGQAPKQLMAIDWDKFQALYTSLLDDDEALREIEEIVAFSIPRIKASLEEGKQLYDFIEEAIEIDTVGLLPLYRDAGYLLLRDGKLQAVRAYQYQISIFEHANERYRGIHTQWVGDFRLSIAYSLEAIKLDLVRNQPQLPNPATFAISARMQFPEEAALMPVAKRKFVRFLAGLGE
jgi:hypothetical protein